VTASTSSAEGAFVADSTQVSTQLKKDAFGVAGILFFVLSAQAPLTSIVGAAGVAIALGNGAGVPGAYLAVGAVIVLFSVGFTTMTRHVDSRGGFFPIIRAGLGPRVGTGGSLVALLSYNAVQLAMYGLFGASLSALVAEHLHAETPWWLWAAAGVAAVWFLGSRRIEVGAQVLAVLVSVEILLLVAFGIGVLADRGLGSLDVGASFGPSAILAGAPGVAIMFAIACMFGFESTAIYSGEAKDPRRTVPRATYIAVVVIAIFLAAMTWLLVAYYGADDVQGAAMTSLAGDPASFAVGPLDDVLGSWAGTAASILLCTSLFAGILAFHNMITRYLHAMAGAGILPSALQRTNRHLAPATASLVQTVVAVVVVGWFAVVGLDPVAQLFSWFAGLAVAALVVLYVLTSLSVVSFFRRRPVETNPWTTRLAPALSAVLMVGVLAMVVDNFDVLTGGTGLTLALLLGSVPATFAVGALRGSTSRLRPDLELPQLTELTELA
jgi:amino acid transporter